MSELGVRSHVSVDTPQVEPSSSRSSGKSPLNAATYEQKNPDISRQEGQKPDIPDEQLVQRESEKIDSPTFEDNRPESKMVPPKTPGSTESAGSAGGVAPGAIQKSEQTSPASTLERTSAPTVDLSNGEALLTKTKEAISFILDPSNAGKISNFFIGSENLIDAISKNKELKGKLQEIVAKLDNYSSNDSNALNEIHSLFQETYNLITEDKNISNHSPFPQFIQGIMKSIDVSIAKTLAQEVLQEFKPKIEERLHGQNISSTLSAGASVDQGIMHAGLGVGRTTSQTGTGDNALFETSTSYGISANVGVGQQNAIGVFKASLDLTARLDLIFTTMYSSIEQLIETGTLDQGTLDSLKERIFDGLKKHVIDKFSAKQNETGEALLSEEPENGAKGGLTTEATEALSEALDKQWNEAIRNVTSARRKLQDTEIKFSRSAGNVENFLRMTGAVSLNDHVKRPHVTRAEAPLRKTTLTAKVTVSGELSSTFCALGLDASVGGSVTSYNAPRHYLALLKDDCSPNANLTAEQVGKAAGSKECSLSGKHKLDASTPSASINMLSSLLHEYNSVLQSAADLSERKENIAEEKKQLKKDIKQLESSIKKLKKNSPQLKEADQRLKDANQQLKGLRTQLKGIEADIEELTGRKHKCEESLSSKGSEGRLGVFKSCIVTAAKIREQASAETDSPVFKRMFQELETLESLLEFSKDEASRSGASMQKAHSHTFDTEISGTFRAGGTSITFQGNDRSGSPFLNENGTFMAVSLKTASDTVAELSGGAIGAWLADPSQVSLVPRSRGEGIREQLLPDEGNSDDSGESATIVATAKSALTGALDLKEAVLSDLDSAGVDVSEAADFAKGIVDKINPSRAIVDKIENKASEVADKVTGFVDRTVGKVLSDFETTSRDLPEKETEVKVKLVKVESNTKKAVKSLPGRNPIGRDRSKWVSLYSERTVTSNSEKGAQATVVGTGGAVTVKVGSSEQIQESRIQQLGTDTMRHITSVFDTTQRGDSTAWSDLKENHGNELSEMLKNLANANSNISYELQCLYNDILNNVGADTDLGKQCTELFGKLLKNCESFSAGNIDLETALTSLEEALTLNYEHNSSVHFNRAFSLHKEPKTTKPKTTKKGYVSI